MQWRLIYPRVILLGLLSLAVIFRDQLITVALPFLLAFVLAAMIEPAVDALERKLRLPRGLAVLIALILLMAISGYLLGIVLAKVLAELADLAGRLPAYQQEVIRVADQVLERLGELYQYLPLQVHTYLQSTVDDLTRNAMAVVGDLADKALRTITRLPSLLVVSIVTVLATYFFSKDRQQLTEGLFNLAPRRWRNPLRQAQDKILVDLVGYLKAQVFIFLISTFVSAVGLYWIGTRFWMILGIILGILDAIPVLGPGLVLFPWAAIALLLERPDQAAQLILLFVVILAVRQISQAKVLGDSIGVHPLSMLIALYGGIVIFGVIGIVLGPLLVIIGRALWNAGIFARLQAGARGETLPDEEEDPSSSATSSETGQDQTRSSLHPGS